MSDLHPGRWWRVLYADRRRAENGPDRLQLWCETSDEHEAREALVRCPGGGVLQQLYERTEREWRDA
jgi:hypothetical protein